MIEAVHVPDVLGHYASRRHRNTAFGSEDWRITTAQDRWSISRNSNCEYLHGDRDTIDLPSDLQGTKFELDVWNAPHAIPYGERRSYRDIAIAVNKLRGAQAVGKRTNVIPFSSSFMSPRH